MELTFVNQYSGDPPKRRRLAKACESCRARKKRCVHFSGVRVDDNGNNRSSFFTPDGNDDDNSGSSSDGDGESHNKSSRNKPGSRGLHFLGDLVPASTLLKSPKPPGLEGQKQPDEDLGIWVDRREWDILVKQRADAGRLADGSVRDCVDTRPHSAVLAPLIDIYFQKINPILPLVDEEQFRKDHVGGIVPEPMVHAMCLIAAKDLEAEPHLRLTGSAAPVPLRRFCSILHASVVAALRVPVRFEKVTLIRILALVSLHNEGADGAEEASIHLSKAMHHAQTLGIHLEQQAVHPAACELSLKRLFWCLYAMDRASSAMNGRPIIMSDVDIASRKFEPGESGFPAFEAWLRVVELLNKVISFYRPRTWPTSTGWEGPYPGLEEIFDDVQAWDVPPSILATIHLFYLAVAILSHRTHGMREMPRAIASQVRQRLCAIEVIRLMTSPSAKSLHPLPILPYAVSLSLSVAYQHLRQSQLEYQQADALADFRTCCAILQDLRRTWNSAEIMATLAQRVLEELDRAPDLASFRVHRAARQDPHVVNETTAGNELIPAPSACRHEHHVGVTKGLGTLSTTAGKINTDDVAATAAARGSGVDEEGLIPSMDKPEDEDGGDANAAAAAASLFNNIDDVFGTFMDPNYPLNLEDMSFVDDFAWQPEASAAVVNGVLRN